MRKTVDRVVAGYRTYTTEMAPMRALQLLPELLSVITPAIGAVKREGVDLEAEVNLESVAPALDSMAKALCGGKLAELIPQILRETSVVVPIGDGGAPEKVDLLNASEIDRAFSGRLSALFPVILFSLEVTFKDFLSGSGLFGKKTPKPALSKVFSPST